MRPAANARARARKTRALMAALDAAHACNDVIAGQNALNALYAYYDASDAAATMAKTLDGATA